MNHRTWLSTFLIAAQAVALLAGCGGGPVRPLLPATATRNAAAAPRGVTVPVAVNISLPEPKAALQGLRTRRVNLTNVAYVDVRATHPGAAIDTEATGNPMPVTNNQATATLNLTIGPNQIVIVQGLDKRSKPVPGALIKGVVSVTENATATVTINSGTTPTATILEVIYGADPVLAGKVDAAKIQALVSQITGAAPYTTKPSLVDAQVIAAQILTGDGAVPVAPTADMTLQAGTITVHVVSPVTNQPLSGAAVVVSDPLSALVTTNSNGDATITNVAPGFWSVVAGGSYMPVSVGQVLVTSGETTAAEPQPTAYTPQQYPNQISTLAIGPTGGTIEIPGVVRLQIPQGALANTYTFKLSSFADPDPTRFYGIRVEPEDLHFNKQATLTFFYTDAQLAGWGVADPTATGQLLLVQYQPVDGGGLPAQRLLPATVDPATKSLVTAIGETGVAAADGTTPTVQGFRVQDTGPVSKPNIDVSTITRVEANGDITLNFFPVPLQLVVDTFAPTPGSVANLTSTATFKAEVHDIDNTKFDYTQIGLQLKGRFYKPDGTITGWYTFALQSDSTQELKKLQVVSPTLNQYGWWHLKEIQLFLNGKPIYTAQEQKAGVTQGVPVAADLFYERSNKTVLDSKLWVGVSYSNGTETRLKVKNVRDVNGVTVPDGTTLRTTLSGFSPWPASVSSQYVQYNTVNGEATTEINVDYRAVNENGTLNVRYGTSDTGPIIASANISTMHVASADISVSSTIPPAAEQTLATVSNLQSSSGLTLDDADNPVPLGTLIDVAAAGSNPSLLLISISSHPENIDSSRTVTALLASGYFGCPAGVPLANGADFTATFVAGTFSTQVETTTVNLGNQRGSDNPCP